MAGGCMLDWQTTSDAWTRTRNQHLGLETKVCQDAYTWRSPINVIATLTSKKGRGGTRPLTFMIQIATVIATTTTAQTNNK